MVRMAEVEDWSLSRTSQSGGVILLEEEGRKDTGDCKVLFNAIVEDGWEAGEEEVEYFTLLNASLMRAFDNALQASMFFSTSAMSSGMLLFTSS